jgi:hypothetical protein
MTQLLLFSSETGIFDKFPVRNLNYDTTVILDHGFRKDLNKHFIKELMIHGLRMIDVIEPKNLDKVFNKINIQVKDSSEELEFLEKPILYYNSDLENFKITFICNHCKEECIRESFPISKNMKEPRFCSNKCIMDSSESESDFSSNNKIFEIDPKNPSNFDGINGRKPKNFTYVKDSDNRDDKFQNTMRREAIRLEYAERREKYKKQMRQISTRKSNTKTPSLKKELNKTVSNTNMKCNAKTKKGTVCGNRVQPGSNYCGITSHQEQDSKYKKIVEEMKEDTPVMIEKPVPTKKKKIKNNS